ncbi:MAG: GNAT family N-acetyltransferase [Paracoccus sp. (in: a-proteobacteria)]|nr:GNAT family N-acetyltransferase [Paracoccus sp. (in: a-proteobacteria)]
MKVTLREPTYEDSAQIARVMQDPQALGWLSALPAPDAHQGAIDFHARAAMATDMCIAVDGKFAGLIRDGADLGYWIAPEYRGRGLATIAGRIAIIRHFAQSRVPINAWHFIGHEPGRRVLLRLGFRDFSQTMMDWQGGRALPAQVMRLSAEDFTAALEIATPRCRIRPMRDDDLAMLHRIATRPEVARMLLRFAPGQSLAESEAIFRPAMDPLTRPQRMVIWHQGGVAGSIGVSGGDLPSVFYFIAPELAGQGLASEVVPAFCEAVQGWFALPEITAEAFADNPASIRVLEKSGFHRLETRMMPSAGRPAPAPGLVMLRS